jgi:hypothetical protein
MAETSGCLHAGLQVPKETLKHSNLKRASRDFPAAQLWLVCRLVVNEKK